MDRAAQELRDYRNTRHRELAFFQKRYKNELRSLDKSPLSRVRPITEDDHYALGKQLFQFEDMHESQGTSSNLGFQPTVALETISVMYGASPLAVFAGIQPIEEQKGAIYFYNFVSQTSRGNVTTGQKLISARSIPDNVNIQGFAGNGVTNEPFIAVLGGGTQNFPSVQLGGSGAFMTPIDPRTVTINGSVVFSTGTAVFTTMLLDPNTLTFQGAAYGGATLYGVTGSVNPQLGQVTLNLSADPTGATDFFCSYQPMPEGGVDLTTVNLELDSMQVQSQDYILKSTVGLFEAYQLNKRLGLNAEEKMTQGLVALMNQEITNDAIAQLIASTNLVGNSVTWNRGRTNISTFEQQQSLKNAMADTSALLYNTAGRGNVNVWLAGLSACAIISQLPGFKKLYDDMDFGSHIYGTIDGVTIVRVPYQAVLDNNTMIGLHRGREAFDCPVVWSPYMPIFSSNSVPNGYNAASQQRIVACSGAISVPVPNLTTKLIINQAGFSY